MQWLSEKDKTILTKYGISDSNSLNDADEVVDLLAKFRPGLEAGNRAFKGDAETVEDFKTIIEICNEIARRNNWSGGGVQYSWGMPSRYGGSNDTAGDITRGIHEFGLSLASLLRAGVDNSKNERALELMRRMFNPTNALF